MTTKQLAVASILALAATPSFALNLEGQAPSKNIEDVRQATKAPKAPRVIPETLEGGHKVSKAEHCSSRACRPWKEGDVLVITCASGKVIVSTPAGLEKAAEFCK